MRNSEILYPPIKWLEKALELIGTLDHEKPFFLCIFSEKKSIYQRGEDVFVFKVTHQYIPSIVVTNRHNIVIAAEPRVVTLVVNISTCSYNWKDLSESFPAHLHQVS